jgi:MinD-like ATPase involved in chromosome partitioning or flagellar assembly
VIANPQAEVGVTIHGVSAISEARTAFEHLSRITEEQLGLVLASYGLLVDDLHVYRAIAAQRPIGLAHPQAPATRALKDVARLLYEDARNRVLG